MQIHKIQAVPRNNSTTNNNKVSKEIVATKDDEQEEEDEFWDVPSDYPAHLLHRKPTKIQQNNKLKTPATTKPNTNKNNTTNTTNKNINAKQSYAQPRPPIKQHPHTATKLHVVNASNGKKIIEKQRVPMITNQPPTNNNNINNTNNSNKNVIVTNKFLSSGDQMSSKEYNYSRYAETDDGFPHSGLQGSTESFSVHDAIRAAVSSFETSPPSPSPTLSHHSQYLPPPPPPFPSSSSRHSQHLPPPLPSSFSNPPSSSPHFHHSNIHFPSHSHPPLSTDDLIQGDVDYEEEMLKQRAIKLQEDMERLKAKKSLANFYKFEEELKMKKQREYEMVETNCKQKLESQIVALYEEKEKNTREYKLFQLDLEEKINHLLKVQADLNYKINTLETSYFECAKTYKRECNELLRRERSRIEDEFAAHLRDWKHRQNIE